MLRFSSNHGPYSKEGVPVTAGRSPSSNLTFPGFLMRPPYREQLMKEWSSLAHANIWYLQSKDFLTSFVWVKRKHKPSHKSPSLRLQRHGSFLPSNFLTAAASVIQVKSHLSSSFPWQIWFWSRRLSTSIDRACEWAYTRRTCCVHQTTDS